MRSVQGDMVWDAKNMKWQGNAQALQAFDHVLSSSARPALISPGMAKPRTSAGLTAGLGGVRVVGDMVFDPVLMSWHHLDAQGEEELDFGDDEADIPSVNFGSSQDAIKLSSKASFHSQDGDSACSQSGKNEFIEACHTAQTRHEQEMKSFPANVKERDDRNYLWKIRKVRLSSSQIFDHHSLYLRGLGFRSLCRGHFEKILVAKYITSTSACSRRIVLVKSPVT